MDIYFQKQTGFNTQEDFAPHKQNERQSCGHD